MPPIWFAGPLVHATTALIAAFLVFFVAERSRPALRIFGLVLGGWLVVVAIVQVYLGPPAPPARLPQSRPLPAPTAAK